MTRLLLSAAIVLTAALPVSASDMVQIEIPDTKPAPPIRVLDVRTIPKLAYLYDGQLLTGLKQTTRRGVFHHSFHYAVEDSDKLVVVEKKLKGVPDLRTYEEAHPVKAWVQSFCERWNPVMTTGFSAAGAYAAIRGKLFQ